MNIKDRISAYYANHKIDTHVAALSVGAILIVGSILALTKAAGSVVSTEVESGTKSLQTIQVADSTASGGQAVKFGSVQTTNCLPDVNATMTNTVSHLCGFPDTTNTGPAAGTTFSTVPDQVTSGPGWYVDYQYQQSAGFINVVINGNASDDPAHPVVVSGLRFNKIDVLVWGYNVVLKNCVFYSSGDTIAINLMHSKNATIQNNTVYGDTQYGPSRLSVALKDTYGDSTGTIFQYNNIYHTNTSIQLAQGIVRGNYVHDMSFDLGADHVNGFTDNGGSSIPLLIDNNTILNQMTQTDAISIFEDFGAAANVTVKNNLLAGGGYPLYCASSAGAVSPNEVVTGNRFSTMYYTDGGSYGTVSSCLAANGVVTWSDNKWIDDYGGGVVLTPQGTASASTALFGSRQYPTGNGPRRGQAVNQ